MNKILSLKLLLNKIVIFINSKVEKIYYNYQINYYTINNKYIIQINILYFKIFYLLIYYFN